MENVWYNAYRPQQFNEVIGQDLAVRVLKNAIETKRIKNGYLLSGSRGVGKTTIARIFAKSLNNVIVNPEANIDIYEMDAASNTSVDDIRLLIENASTPPLAGEYKIFIIDEVHMLSKSAMNALLKILEEPPVYLVFVFATTNPEKVIPTVLSRLIKLDLINHTQENLEKNLESIAKKEKMDIDKESISLIAKKANGGQRDAINYLQTVFDYNLPCYKANDIAAILGIMPSDILDAFIYTIKAKDVTLEYKKSLIANIEKLQITPIALINQLLEKLLDDHFNNLTKNSDLITILADYASLNLPINNIIEVLSYLDYKFINKQDIDLIKINDSSTFDISTQKKTKKIEQKKDTTNSISTTTQNEEIDLSSVSFNTNIDFSTKPSEPKGEFDIAKYNKILSRLDKNVNTSIMLKSHLNSLFIREENGALILSKTNKENFKLDISDVQFVNEVFDNLVDGKHNIQCDFVTESNVSPMNIEIENSTQIKLENTEEITTFKANKKESKTTETTHFYKVFKKLPKNTPTTIEVVESIEDPKIDNNDIQDEGIHDLFDL
jgi:DNA polymerase III subunit gamma/tau